ncbi:MAG: hypothetical protein A2X25_07630 [Chloroflexi bacterium GWB2_49_20]|nr:MAG: hypothetical protein A2X25_07630 [Chloroflexi bacterium GWB2_49_20]OGN78024.1 MAG: hypothetical protein A2X26_15435 [Chloroflexi bacterium GWC2_49_37]OGN85062.1 MAG: hypothetical protein A2X27_10135 [Chloroflexi bacterium GWD2_49_16]HBG74901.1 hypothetical protein [Anaerolineae bacterium]HCC78375.1 hypothetical protein [Anaerolineae bacterium]
MMKISITLKNLVLLIFIPTILLMITACGDSSTSQTTITATPPQINKIRVAVSPDWYPWEYIDPITNELTGFDVNLMKTIGRDGNFEVEFVQVPFDEIFDGLGTTYDVAISAIQVTPDRENKVLFSQDYQNIGEVLVVPYWNRAIWGLNDVAGKKAAALKNSIGARNVQSVDPSALVEYDNNDQMFSDLLAADRKIDIVITDYLTAVSYTARKPGSVRITAPITTENLAVAISKNRKDIKSVLDYYFALEVKNYVVKELIQKYLAIPPEQSPSNLNLNGSR